MSDTTDLKLSSEANAQTGSARALERAAMQAVLTRVRRGAYLASDAWQALSPEEQQRVRIEAARQAAQSEPLFSHDSAAVIHGIPLTGKPPARVHTTVTHGRAKTNAAVIRTHRDIPDADIVVTEDGIRVTSPARTAIDLAASGSALAGRFAVDHVRRHLGVTIDQLRDVLASAGRIRGVRRVRLAISRSSALSDSPLETLVLVRCADFGFVAPSQQVEVRGLDGRIYRVDFGWRDGRVLLEADGRTKYRNPVILAGRVADDVLWSEKRREDAIRPMCDALARVSWDDAWSGIGLERRLLAIGVPRQQSRTLTLTF